MKIFNKENGIEKVYVQLDDISFLLKTCSDIPNSIQKRIYSDENTNISDSNKMDFVEFTEPEVIEFMRNQTWIVDYKQARDLSKKELKFLIKKTQLQIQAITRYLISKNGTDSLASSLVKQWNQLVHKSTSYKILYQNTIGNITIPIPLAPDSEGFSMTADNLETPYQIRAGLIPNTLLLFRKDGKPLSNQDQIPQNFIQSAIILNIIEQKSSQNSSKEFSTSYQLSEDKRYFVIKVHFISPEKKRKTTAKQFTKTIFRKKTEEE